MRTLRTAPSSCACSGVNGTCHGGARSSPCTSWRPGGPSTRASSSPDQGRPTWPGEAPWGLLVTCASLPSSDLAFLVNNGICPPHGGGWLYGNEVTPAQPGPWRDGGRAPDWLIRQVIGGTEGTDRAQLACRPRVAEAPGTGTTGRPSRRRAGFPLGTWSETKNYHGDFS